MGELIMAVLGTHGCSLLTVDQLNPKTKDLCLEAPKAHERQELFG